jgi:DNA-directed RNA polymerase subunit RPC12/RpoP
MVKEIYACENCGALFIPGSYAHDDLVEEDGKTRRHGHCPVCDYDHPKMFPIMTLADGKAISIV